MAKKETAAHSKGGQKKKKKKRLRLLLLIEIILILLLVPVAFFVYQISRIPTYHMDESQITINDLKNDDMKNYRNIVVFGVDSRANDLKKNTRSDSIIVVSIHKKTKEIRLLSLYRDTSVKIDGHGYTKLNHAYAYGGPELAISTINKNFDLDIKDFVTVNFSALTNVIDQLGGIPIDITEAELAYVNAYTRDVARINGTECIYLKKAGKQTLNGTQATAYCRVRYTKGGDFTRAQRQRTVLYAIMEKAKSSSVPTLVSLMDTMLPQIYTSLNTTDILSLSTGIFSYDIKEDAGFPFDSKNQKLNKADMVVPTTLSSNVTKLHEYLFQTQGYTPTETVASISRELP